MLHENPSGFSRAVLKNQISQVFPDIFNECLHLQKIFIKVIPEERLVFCLSTIVVARSSKYSECVTSLLV